MGQVAPRPFTVTVDGKEEVFFQPHAGKQMYAIQRIANRVRFGGKPSKFFLRGTRGSGKSVLTRKGICHALALMLPKLTYVLVRRNMPDLKLNHLRYVGAEMRMLTGESSSWNKTDAQATYPNGSMGFFRQCEDEADVEKIVGAEGVVLVVDEAPQISWEHLRTMAPSMRVAKAADGSQPFYPVEIYLGNPMGESIDELDHYFVEKDVNPEDDPLYDPDEWECIDINLTDNPSLDPKEYIKQFAGVPTHFRKAWVDGVRMDARALFDVNRTITRGMLTEHLDKPRPVSLDESMLGKPYHYIQELPTIGGVELLRVPWIQIYRSFDMGYHPDPAICLWHAVIGNRVITFHEETWFKTAAPDLAIKICEITRELVGDRQIAMTYVDPKIAEQRGDVVTMSYWLETGGVPCEPSINDRILYADALHAMLGTEVEPGLPKWQIYEPGCPMLARYLPKMQWDKTNQRKMADHKYDHWPIGAAYFAISSGILAVSEAPTEAKEPVWMAWLRESQQRPGSRRRVS